MSVDNNPPRPSAVEPSVEPSIDQEVESNEPNWFLRTFASALEYGSHPDARLTEEAAASTLHSDQPESYFLRRE